MRNRFIACLLLSACGCAPRFYVVESVDSKLMRQGISLERIDAALQEIDRRDADGNKVRDLQMENAALRSANEFLHKRCR